MKFDYFLTNYIYVIVGFEYRVKGRVYALVGFDLEYKIWSYGILVKGVDKELYIVAFINDCISKSKRSCMLYYMLVKFEVFTIIYIGLHDRLP